MRYDYKRNETRDGIISGMKRDGMILIGLKHESGLWLEWNRRSDYKWNKTWDMITSGKKYEIWL